MKNEFLYSEKLKIAQKRAESVREAFKREMKAEFTACSLKNS